MFDQILQNVQERTPLVHNITNYVTVNDCANILLAAGGSPIMADDAQEVEEIISICDALNINIGTLNSRTIPGMHLALRKARELGHPVVLDPVGAGASGLRTDTAKSLIDEGGITLLRGNVSEIKALALGTSDTHGVDAALEDAITPETLDAAVAFARDVAEKTGAIVAMTGPIDVISDAEKTYCISNGNADMGRITGTGCQLSALCAAFLAANPETPLEAAAAAVGAMGLCGEIAKARMGDQDGNSSMRNYLIDAISNLTPEELEKGIRCEVR